MLCIGLLYVVVHLPAVKIYAPLVFGSSLCSTSV